ncbi:uncharacterized protein LOC142587067 isoform X1 [Dermacentor variabilis]|uniref:uncharacterized protein LOC142587067 isoform X1 n=1 Tax=Dermacentor variabilis TaxID=34621 RepID=UPI003F5BCC74
MLWIGRIEEYGQSNRILRNRAGNYGTRESSRDVLRLRVSAHGRVERDPPTCRLQDYSVPWYVFHLLVEQGLIYICATLPEASMHQSFTCLFLIKQRFLEGSLSSRAWTAQEHELDRDFGSVIADILNNCNSGRTGDQISQLHRQVEDVRGIMAQNIERVVERGDRLDSLLEKTQDLEQAAFGAGEEAQETQPFMHKSKALVMYQQPTSMNRRASLESARRTFCLHGEPTHNRGHVSTVPSAATLLGRPSKHCFASSRILAPWQWV